MTRASIVTILCLFLLSCGEPIPRVKIGGANPPTFTISRTDVIYFEVCCETDHDQPPYHNDLWKISHNGHPTSPLEIVYGDVPKGYVQFIPENNKPAPGLVGGRRYHYEAMGSWGAKVGMFEIRDGKAVEVE